MPLTNANEWAISLNQIPFQFPTLSSMYGEALTPHPRMLAALRLAYNDGRSVPILKVDGMWNETDEIETTRFTYEGTGNGLTQSMSGHDKCLTTIVISTIEEWKKRLVCLWIGLFLVGCVRKDSVESIMYSYLQTMDRTFTEELGKDIRALQLLDIELRTQVQKDCKRSLTLSWADAIHNRALKDPEGRLYLQGMTAKVLMRVKDSGFKAAELHSKGSPAEHSGTAVGYSPDTINKMVVELNALKRKGREQAHGQGKRARSNSALHGERRAKHMLVQSGSGTPNSKKGKSKGKGGGRGKGGKAKRGATQPEYPSAEHGVLQRLMKDPINYSVCRHFNSSASCGRGNNCKFQHCYMQCGLSGHGLMQCRKLSKELKQELTKK